MPRGTGRLIDAAAISWYQGDIAVSHIASVTMLEAAMTAADSTPVPDQSVPSGSSAPSAPSGAGDDALAATPNTAETLVAPQLPAGSADGAQAVALLVKALGLLPDAERDQVYTWLLGRSLTGPYGSLSGPVTLGPLTRRVSSLGDQLLSLQRQGGSPGAQTAQQVVPVRFPAEQHAQLRAWCTEHGFSMATVIRGLVARFLDGQLPARN